MNDNKLNELVASRLKKTDLKDVPLESILALNKAVGELKQRSKENTPHGRVGKRLNEKLEALAKEDRSNQKKGDRGPLERFLDRVRKILRDLRDPGQTTDD